MIAKMIKNKRVLRLVNIKTILYAYSSYQFKSQNESGWFQSIGI